MVASSLFQEVSSSDGKTSKLSGEALYGDILAFIAAGIITAYFFISQHVRKDLSLIPYSVISYGSSACFSVYLPTCSKNLSSITLHKLGCALLA